MQSRWARRVFVAARVTRADRQALNEEGATARNSIGLPVVVEICGDCAEK
jgi:hypothetical protein